MKYFPKNIDLLILDSVDLLLETSLLLPALLILLNYLRVQMLVVFCLLFVLMSVEIVNVLELIVKAGLLRVLAWI